VNVNAMLARLDVHRLRGERGQTMAEYVVVLAVISVAVIAALSLLAGGVSTRLTDIAGSI
jgi:Flp pilus assembly pilin Flp